MCWKDSQHIFVMISFLSLPDVVLHKVFVGWLRLDAVCRFDSAFCVHKDRQTFHNIAFHSQCLYDGDVKYMIVERELLCLRWLLLRNVQMDSLDLHFAPNSDVIEILGKSLNALRIAASKPHIRLECCSRSFICFIPRNCHKLVELTISLRLTIEFNELKSILVECTQLAELSIAHACIGPTNYVGEAWNNKALALSKLALKGVDISALAFTEIVHHCPQLRQLSINHCNLINDNCFQHVASCCPRLVELYLSEMPVTDAAIVSVTSCGSSLTTIHLINMYRLTSASLIAIAAGCPNLTHFREDCNGIFSPQGLHAIAGGCARLTSLSLFVSLLVDAEVLLAIAAGCPALTELYLTGMCHFEDSFMVSLEKRFKHMRHMEYCSW